MLSKTISLLENNKKQFKKKKKNVFTSCKAEHSLRGMELQEKE